MRAEVAVEPISKQSLLLFFGVLFRFYTIFVLSSEV